MFVLISAAEWLRSKLVAWFCMPNIGTADTSYEGRRWLIHGQNVFYDIHSFCYPCRMTAVATYEHGKWCTGYRFLKSLQLCFTLSLTLLDVRWPERYRSPVTRCSGDFREPFLSIIRRRFLPQGFNLHLMYWLSACLFNIHRIHYYFLFSNVMFFVMINLC